MIVLISIIKIDIGWDGIIKYFIWNGIELREIVECEVKWVVFVWNGIYVVFG